MQQPQLPPTVYATFAGMIDQTTLPRLFQGINTAINGNVQDIHLLFQSTGGSIADGISLYNYFNGLPLNLHLYNTGSIQSIAVIAYLGGDFLYVSRHANFMIHKSHFSAPERSAASRFESAAQALKAEDARIEAILKAETTIPAEVWQRHTMQEVYISAQDSVSYGIASEIEEFVVPPGSQIFNL
jgi:ATP-dependent Clp protease protease subunit